MEPRNTDMLLEIHCEYISGSLFIMCKSILLSMSRNVKNINTTLLTPPNIYGLYCELRKTISLLFVSLS